MRNVGQCKNWVKRQKDYTDMGWRVKKQRLLYAALQRVPWERWRKRIIWRPPISEMNHYEVMLIKQFKSQDPVWPGHGYNIYPGGNLGPKGLSIPHTKKTKRKMSKSHTGVPRKESTRLAISKGKRKMYMSRPPRDRCHVQKLENGRFFGGVYRFKDGVKGPKCWGAKTEEKLRDKVEKFWKDYKGD